MPKFGTVAELSCLGTYLEEERFERQDRAKRGSNGAMQIGISSIDSKSLFPLFFYVHDKRMNSRLQVKSAQVMPEKFCR